MKLYATPTTRGTRAVWALEEANATYEYHNISLMKGEARKPEYKALNPGGKVPTLVDGDLVLTESGAICLYIADKYPESGLLPQDPALRAKAIQWCFFAISELEQPLWTKSKHLFAIPEKYRVPAVIDTAMWEFSKAAEVLSIGLGDKEYILGDTFCAADILLSHSLAWAQKAHAPVTFDNVTAYAKRALSRPAMARAVAREKAA